MSSHYLENVSVFSIILFFAIAGLTAYYAQFKGRNPVAWFFISLLIGFVAPLILMFLPKLGADGQPVTEETVNIPVSQEPVPSINQPPAFRQDERIEGEDKLWYYMDQSYQQMGPVSVIALRELWHTGRLDLTTYVWSEGMEDWKKVDELPDLKAILNKTYVM